MKVISIIARYLLGPGIAPALVACGLWVLVFLQYRNSFNRVLAARPAEPRQTTSRREAPANNRERSSSYESSSRLKPAPYPRWQTLEF